MEVTRILIVDDEKLTRIMLREVLSGLPEIEVVGEASTGEEAIWLVLSLRPHVVLMDIELGDGLNGIQAGHAIKSWRPDIGIVLLSGHKSSEFVVGAAGWSYLLKTNVSDIQTLIRAIKGASWGLSVVDPEVIDALGPKPDGLDAEAARAPTLGTGTPVPKVKETPSPRADKPVPDVTETPSPGAGTAESEAEDAPSPRRDRPFVRPPYQPTRTGSYVSKKARLPARHEQPSQSGGGAAPRQDTLGR